MCHCCWSNGQEKNTDKYIDFCRDINGKIDVTSKTIQLSVILTMSIEGLWNPPEAIIGSHLYLGNHVSILEPYLLLWNVFSK